MAQKQKIADIVATLDAETAKFDEKISKSSKRLNDYGKEAKKANGENKGLGSSFDDATGKAAQLPGPVGEAAGKIESFTSTVKGLGTAWTITGGALAVGIAAMTGGLPTLAETERRLLQQEQLIRATGYSSGYTAQQLDSMARSLAMATLTSTQEASKAIGVMLTFRSVTGDTFKRSIYLAQDMASVMGGDITSAAKQLGKALEMPTEGVTALKKSGVSFSESQRAVIKDMEETGRIAEAQRYILDELDRQIGGAAGAEAGGLTGTVDTFGQTWEEMLESLSDKSGAMFFAKTTLEGLIDIASGFKNLIDPAPMEEFQDLLKRRIELKQKLDDFGDPDQAWFGKDRWINLNREYGEVTARMIELQEQFKQEQIAQSEAQQKAADAAAERDKTRLEERKAREDKAAQEKAQKENKRRQEREAAEKAANEKSRAQEQARTATWLVEIQRRNMSAVELLDARLNDEKVKLQAKLDDELISQEQYQRALNELNTYYSRQRLEQVEKENKEREEKNQSFWDKYYLSMQKSASDTDQLWASTYDNFTTGFGDAFSSAILDSESASDAFQGMAEGMARSMLAALGKIMAQRAVMWALEKTMAAGEASSQVAQVTAEGQSASLLAGIHAYSSTAAIPITGPALAPGAAAAAIAATEPMAAAATTAAAAGFAGMFDSGGFIPAGQWGITGEIGPEITLGPTQVIGRKKTAELLSQSGGDSGPSVSQTVEQHFHLSDVYGDESVKAIIKQAAKEGSNEAYQRVANDFATGRGIRKTLNKSTGL
ncbi:phage tail length tape measure family protein [Vibrio fluvialis]|uniref:phage tail length tape measure family protein n=1 Tax=Vibrio fluvialis TaxID=676 RepID=UPI00192C6862|nr:phage tail length tape measure family protein [Vibrio fluvialis]MBL4297850.1 phage tail length tape measure family protein [Vibrio fluvialis]